MAHAVVADAGIEIDTCTDHGSWYDKSELQQVAASLAQRKPAAPAQTPPPAPVAEPPGAPPRQPPRAAPAEQSAGARAIEAAGEVLANAKKYGGEPDEGDLVLAGAAALLELLMGGSPGNVPRRVIRD
jgi:hypothetical protein